MPPPLTVYPSDRLVRGSTVSLMAAGLDEASAVVFHSEGASVSARPDLVRPHWILLRDIPAAIPSGTGPVEVEVVSDRGRVLGSTSVRVGEHAHAPVTVLAPGRPVGVPYTIAFVANPAIHTDDNRIIADPVLEDRAAFTTAVVRCLRALLTLEEDVLRQDGLDAAIRFVTVFDPASTSDATTVLAYEYAHAPVMVPRRENLNGYLERFDLSADIVFVIHAAPGHHLACAQCTTDDVSKARTPVLVDGGQHYHGQFARIPGCAAIPVGLADNSPLALHEFIHAASDFNEGKVVDLYVDESDGFLVNKRYRDSSASPIPDRFATLERRPYRSALQRAGLPYPPTWRSYHPAPRDTTRPNLMDDYRRADDPCRCRVDSLTRAWLRGRLRAKVYR